jgi:DNA replication protein DnaC
MSETNGDREAMRGLGLRHPVLECTGARFVDGRAVVCEQPECAREQRRREARAAREDFPRLGLQRYAEAILSGAVEERAVLTVARAWANLRDRPFLILLGPVGTGKTLAGLLALSVACYDFGYLSAARLHGLRACALEDYGGTRGLLLDDLGLEALGRDAAAVNLFDLINTRYMGNRATVITSNLSERGLQARYDDRILRRLAEAGIWYDGYKGEVVGV